MKKVIDFLKNNLNNKDAVVVACSGGPDSMCLLDLVTKLKDELNLKIIVAHVNHKLRIESEEEAQMVEKYAKNNGLIFELLEINEYLEKTFTEEDARRRRYEFFYELLKKYNAKKLLTAHHGDDLIETILMRIVRGSTLQGYSGFSKVYEVFKRAEVYQGIGYKQLNTELLSHDTVHLGKSQSLLFRLMKLYTEVRDERQPLRDIFPTDKYRDMSFHDLKLLITSLKSLDGNTLDELLIAIFNEYDTSNNQMYKLIIERIFDADEEVSYDGVLRFFLTSLYKTWDETLETKLIIQELLNMKIVELLNWFHYVHRNEKKKICYHTFHSTKGLEYENVAIILGKDFGQDKGLFETFFKEYGKSVDQISSKYEKGRNILYVAVTRAIKNLRILYIDDLEEIRDSMEKVFGKIYEFSNGITKEEF